MDILADVLEKSIIRLDAAEREEDADKHWLFRTLKMRRKRSIDYFYLTIRF
jgi:hypothetical protein